MAAAATGVECFSPVAGGSCMRLREDADARTTRLLAAKASRRHLDVGSRG
jgi:hypothetical protein